LLPGAFVLEFGFAFAFAFVVGGPAATGGSGSEGQSGSSRPGWGGAAGIRFLVVVIRFLVVVFIIRPGFARAYLTLGTQRLDLMIMIC